MVLKLGVLILLLALYNVLAEQRLPTVPKITLQSGHRHSKQVHGSIVSTRHSSVRSLLTNVFRRSFKSTNDLCVWDASRKECSLSATRMISLLEKSDTKFSKIAIEPLKCVIKTNKHDCNKDMACIWDNELRRCEYAPVLIRHEDSPCIQAVPRLSNLQTANSFCGKLNPDTRCQKYKQCDCIDDGDYGGDVGFAFFGIDDLEGKAEHVSKSGAEARQKEYEALQSSPDFTWEALLSHTFEEIECPSNSKSLVCLYANVEDSYRMGPMFYCSKRYTSNIFHCEEDEHCDWNYDSNQCSANYSTLYSASVKAILALLDTLPDGVDKDYSTRLYNCSRFFDQESCRGYCIWNAADTYCDVKSDALAQPFQEIAEKSNDAFCRFLVLTISSPCSNQYTKKSCNKREFCHWHDSGECLQNEELYISAAANENRKLKRRYKKSKKVCSKFKIKSTCPV